MLQTKYKKLIDNAKTENDYKKIIYEDLHGKIRLTQRQLYEVVDYKNGVKVKNVK